MADLTPEALAADLEALAAAKDAKAASADTEDMCAWYRGCSAGLANAAGRIRHYLVPAHAALAGQLAAQHEAMTQLRADHREVLAALTAERDRYRAALERGRRVLRSDPGEVPLDDAELIAVIGEALEGGHG